MRNHKNKTLMHATSRRLLLLGGHAAVLAGCGGSRSTTVTPVTAAPTRDLMTQMASDSDLNRFVEAINRTAVNQVLHGGGVYTVFAPTDSGWGSIPVNIRDDVLPPNGPADPVRGRALVISHMVEGRHTAAQLAGKRTVLTSLNGNRLVIDGTNPGRITVKSDGGDGFNAGGGAIWGASTITLADIRATNGILHIVDKAVLP
jgi:uncharacterized surface protein with fasciclin (FAS1) repeats